MATLRVNGVRLHYEEAGEGGALLGIHGTPGTALLWQDAAAELARLGRCIVYDRRGFTPSERPEPFDAVDLADHVLDAAEVLESLGAVPAVVIGRSTGGLIALELARRRPDLVRALVLLEPAVFTADAEAEAWAAELRERILHQAEGRAEDASRSVIEGALGEGSWDALPEGVRTALADQAPAVLAEMRGRGLDLSEEPIRLTPEELAAVRVPALVVSAADSPAPLRRVADELTRLLPQAESAAVEGGHLIDPAHEVVRSFAGRVLSGT